MKNSFVKVQLEKEMHTNFKQMFDVMPYMVVVLSNSSGEALFMNQTFRDISVNSQAMSPEVVEQTDLTTLPIFK